jgi:hypothetical protein
VLTHSRARGSQRVTKSEDREAQELVQTATRTAWLINSVLIDRRPRHGMAFRRGCGVPVALLAQPNVAMRIVASTPVILCVFQTRGRVI